MRVSGTARAESKRGPVRLAAVSALPHPRMNLWPVSRPQSPLLLFAPAPGTSPGEGFLRLAPLRASFTSIHPISAADRQGNWPETALFPPSGPPRGRGGVTPKAVFRGIVRSVPQAVLRIIPGSISGVVLRSRCRRDRRREKSHRCSSAGGSSVRKSRDSPSARTRRAEVQSRISSGVHRRLLPVRRSSAVASGSPGFLTG